MMNLLQIILITGVIMWQCLPIIGGIVLILAFAGVFDEKEPDFY